MAGKQLSIQAEARKRGKSVAAYLNDKSRKGAFNVGTAWTADDARTLARLKADGHTIFDIAVRLGRTYYGALNASAHLGFAERCGMVWED